MTSFLCRQELGGDEHRGGSWKNCAVCFLEVLLFFPGWGNLGGSEPPRTQCLRSRRLEVVGEKENGRARERHARGPSPLGSTSFQGFSPTRPTGRREVSSCQIPRGGDEKRGQMPHPSSTLQHFSLITQSNSAILGILMCDFLFQLTSFFCNSARILIKTSRLDDTSVMVLVLL